MSSPLTSTSKGFTLIEVLIVVAIFAAIIGLGAFFNLSFYGSSTLQTDTDIFTSVLQRARARAVNNINESNHGVYISANEYILFQRDSYLPIPSPNPFPDEPISRNSGLVFNPAVPFEIVFTQLSGNAIFPGSGIIVITSQNKTATVSLNNEGLIDR